MTCCPRECAPQHEHSPGPVEDDEVVCRGAYDPIHFTKAKTFKMSVIRPAHLLAGELSVWRRDRDPSFGIDGVVQELEKSKPDGLTLKNVLGPKVAPIRKLQVDRGEGIHTRAFCVIDDCKIDNAGGWHAEHAVISLSDHDGVEWGDDDRLFEMAKEGLLAVFRASIVWKAPS
jgi:hypothetical protein